MRKHPHPGPPPQAGEGEDATSPSRGTICPRLCISFTPFNEEGAGNAGRRLAPAVSCANSASVCAHEHTGTAGAARHSLRDGFTAYTVLSLETNSSCLHRRRIEGSSKPGWVSQNLRRLDTSHGCQNHTALPSATSPFVGARPSLTGSLKPALRKPVARPACRGHRSPHPTSVTIAIRPSCGRGMAGVVGVIWVEREAEYFSRGGLTRFLKIRSDLPVEAGQEQVFI
jgi:hypothetical protein